jgi:hypothetical protein
MPREPRRQRASQTSGAGLGVDKHGGPVIDPTENVLALVQAANERQDDLRDLTKEMFDNKHIHTRALVQMQSDYQRQLDIAESRRLDAIRQVDREDVTKSATQALTAIQALAQETRTTAETLRAQNAAMMAARDAQASAMFGEITKRLSALELQISEGKGKQAVVDPQMDRLTSLVETLAQQQAAGQGKTAGIGATWGILLGVVGLVSTLLMIGGVVVTIALFMSRGGVDSAPIYVPAPAGTALPSNPPGPTPR